MEARETVVIGFLDFFTEDRPRLERAEREGWSLRQYSSEKRKQRQNPHSGRWESVVSEPPLFVGEARLDGTLRSASGHSPTAVLDAIDRQRAERESRRLELEPVKVEAAPRPSFQPIGSVAAAQERGWAVTQRLDDLIATKKINDTRIEIGAPDDAELARKLSEFERGRYDREAA